MTDLIDRQTAIDALAKFVPYAICDESTESYTNGLTDAYNLIRQLPSAEPERKTGRWIPASERLPNNSDPVLVTLKWSEEDYEVSMFEYWESIGGWGDRFNEAVIAWMPMPEPYQGEKDD